MKKFPVYFICIIILMITVSSSLGMERCIMCGMDADKSETKYIITVTKGTNEIKKGDYGLCCLHCLVLLRQNLEAKGGHSGKVLTMDYNTKEMFDAQTAFFLVESKLIPSGSMVPFILGFKEQATARTFQKVYGGLIIDWAKIVKYVRDYK